MKLNVEQMQTIEIPGNDTAVISGLQEQCLFIFDEGKGGLSDKSYILSYHEHSVVLVRSCKELIISNDLQQSISIQYIPVGSQILAPDPQYLRLLDILKKSKDAITVIEVDEETFADIREYCTLIRRESRQNRPYSLRFIKMLESILAAYISRYLMLSWQIRSPENTAIDAAEKMRSLIDSHYELPLSLSYFSSELGLSEQHLSKIFKERYGISYIDHLNRVRIGHARQFLSDTNDLITDIALDVGYNNSTHFCTTFKRLTGVSPNQYRKTHRKKAHLNDSESV